MGFLKRLRQAVGVGPSVRPSSVASAYRVADIEELTRVLQTLDAPSPGTRRVYRGQTRQFVRPDGRISLLPAAARPDFRSQIDPGWTFIATTLAEAMRLPQGQGSNDTFVWVPALLQHYGTGSNYVDVTSDPLVALWFALHQRHETTVEYPLTIDESLTVSQHRKVAWYSRVSATEDANNPVIYVFDAAPWTGRLMPNQGDVVDLATPGEHPNLGGWAERVVAQKACLLYSVSQETALRGRSFPPEEQDMAFAIRAVITIDLRAARWSPEFKSVSELFPKADRDRFLRVIQDLPSRLRIAPLRLEQMLALPHYTDVDDARALLDSPSSRQSKLPPFRNHNPVLFHRMAVQRASAWQSLGDTTLGDRGYRLVDATPVLLETALFTTSHQPMSGWIQSALPLGIADQLANLTTDNVYVEVSPVDFEFHSAGFQRRGVWLCRHNRNYSLTVLGDLAGTIAFARATFIYEPENGHFLCVGFTCEPPATADAVVGLGPATMMEALFVVLLLLRDLSPGLKPPPYYGISVGDVWLPRSVFEPQLARGVIESIGGVNYIIPVSMDGTIYKGDRYHPVYSDKTGLEDAAVFDMLDRYFDVIRDDIYLVEMSKSLGDFHGRQRRWNRVAEVLEKACAAASRAQRPWDQWLLDANRGVAYLKLGDKMRARQALRRAFLIGRSNQKSNNDEEYLGQISQMYVDAGGTKSELAPLDSDTRERDMPAQSTRRPVNVASPSSKLKVTLIFPFSSQPPATAIEAAMGEFDRRFPNTLKSCSVGQDGMLVAVEASSQDEAAVFNATLGDILRKHGFADAHSERNRSPEQ